MIKIEIKNAQRDKTRRYITDIFVLITLYVLPCFGMADLTLEEKVGQVLMVHFQGELANDNAKTLVCDVKVGGVIYYNWANGLYSPEQVSTLSNSLQALTQTNTHLIPLWIAVDQEGGSINRLKEGFTQTPSNFTIAQTNDPEIAREYAHLAGNEMKCVGINMNLAPVVDVNSNPNNPVIGARSFGSNPQTVCAFGEMALKGYGEAGIIAVLKHFPGHGDVGVDSHCDLPVVHKSLAELERLELLPFATLAPMADAIMTAHLLVPAFDEEKCSTLSQKTLTYLRNVIGFEGLIISDSLVMNGVLKSCGTVDEAAIQALQAGCDLLILGGRLLKGNQADGELGVADVRRIHASIVEAVKNGRLSEERLDDAVNRNLKLKQHLPWYERKQDKHDRKAAR